MQPETSAHQPVNHVFVDLENVKTIDAEAFGGGTGRGGKRSGSTQASRVFRFGAEALGSFEKDPEERKNVSYPCHEFFW